MELSRFKLVKNQGPGERVIAVYPTSGTHANRNTTDAVHCNMEIQFYVNDFFAGLFSSNNKITEHRAIFQRERRNS